jgi:hypothetical protein
MHIARALILWKPETNVLLGFLKWGQKEAVIKKVIQRFLRFYLHKWGRTEYKEKLAHTAEFLTMCGFRKMKMAMNRWRVKMIHFTVQVNNALWRWKLRRIEMYCAER